ncbi:hypothetical protein LINPERHAP2_LOCUS41285 [Linum perenne]
MGGQAVGTEEETPRTADHPQRDKEFSSQPNSAIVVAPQLQSSPSSATQSATASSSSALTWLKHTAQAAATASLRSESCFLSATAAKMVRMRRSQSVEWTERGARSVE